MSRSACYLVVSLILAYTVSSRAEEGSPGRQIEMSSPAPEVGLASSDKGRPSIEETAASEDITLKDVFDYLSGENDVSAQGFFRLSRQEAPNSSYAWNESKLNDSDARSIAQLIENFAPGVQTANHPWTGKIIGSRGILIDNNAKTSIMLDGLKLNQRLHFGTHGYLDLPLLGDIRQGDYIMGPGAIVHGSGAINGFVNMQLRNGSDSPGLRARASYGVEEQGGIGEVSYGLPYGKSRNLFVYAGYVQSSGYTPNKLSYDTTQDDPAYMLAAERDPSFKVTLNWLHDNLEVLGLFAQSSASAEYGNSEQIFRIRTPNWLSRLSAGRVRYTFPLSDGHSLTAALSGMVQDYGLYPRDTPASAVETSLGGREWAATGSLIYRMTQFSEHRLAAGVEWTERWFPTGTAQQGVFEPSAFPSWSEAAAFAEDIYKPLPQLTLAAGVRYDLNILPDSISGSGISLALSDQQHLAWRASVVYSLTSEGSLRLSYQNGFRTPDAAYYQHWLSTEGSGRDAPHPDNESLDSIELGYMQHFTDAHLTLDAAIYGNRYQAVLAFSNPLQSFVNASQPFYALGGELRISADITKFLRAEVAYAYVQPFDIAQADIALLQLTSSDGQRWLTYAPHQVKANLAASFFRDTLRVNTNIQIYNPASADDATPNLNPIYTQTPVTWNAAAKYVFLDMLSLKVSVRNLLGNSVPPRSATMTADPAWGNLGIDARLFYVDLTYEL